MPFDTPARTDAAHRAALFAHRDTAAAEARLAALFAPALSAEEKRARWLAERDPVEEASRHLKYANGSLRCIVRGRTFSHRHMLDATRPEDRPEQEAGHFAYAAQQLAAAIRCVDEVIDARGLAVAA